jgi:hypothetical protein
MEDDMMVKMKKRDPVIAGAMFALAAAGLMVVFASCQNLVGDDLPLGNDLTFDPGETVGGGTGRFPRIRRPPVQDKLTVPPLVIGGF